jgi:alpha-L-rhamnosidase
VKKAINEYMWDAARGSYVDCFDKGEQCGTISRQANSLAVQYDIAPAEKQAAIMKLMMDPASDIVRESTPYFSYYVMEALRHVGADDEAMKYDYRWADMLKWGATSFWEWWNTDNSLAHGWSAAPTYDLPKYVLGVYPAAPGFAKVNIAPPRTGGMDIGYASGVVPTPHGDIVTGWSLKAKPASFTRTVTVPNGATAEVWLPVGNIIAPVLTVNGAEKPPAGVKQLPNRNCCLGAEISKPGKYVLVLSDRNKK